MASRALTEDDIPGASLAGRSPATLKNEELRFWLKCRGDSLKGLKTKAQLVKRYDARMLRMISFHFEVNIIPCTFYCAKLKKIFSSV